MTCEEISNLIKKQQTYGSCNQGEYQMLSNFVDNEDVCLPVKYGDTGDKFKSDLHNEIMNTEIDQDTVCSDNIDELKNSVLYDTTVEI